MKHSSRISLSSVLLVFYIAGSDATHAFQAKPATVAEQNIVVRPQDEIKGAEDISATVFLTDEISRRQSASNRRACLAYEMNYLANQGTRIRPSVRTGCDKIGTASCP